MSLAPPKALSTWFVIHFIVDILFATPLMFFPEASLGFFGWNSVDPYTARIVSAALFAIGIESWLSRHASLGTLRNLLSLKVMWSLAATLGIALSLLSGAQGRPLMAWVIFAIFLAFHVLWVYWLGQISKLLRNG
jgi:hypothetical protein